MLLCWLGRLYERLYSTCFGTKFTGRLLGMAAHTGASTLSR